MAKNLTSRQAKFVEIYLENGQKAADAYRVAYSSKMRPGLCAQEGHKLLKNPKIAPIIAEADKRAENAVERAMERYAVSRERNVAELARLAYSNISDFTRLEGPERVTDLSRATRDELAAVQEITIDGVGEKRRVRVKLHDKKAAIAELNHMNGWVIDRQEVGKPGDFSHLSDDELDAQISRRLREKGFNDRQVRNFLLVAENKYPSGNSAEIIPLGKPQGT